MSDNDFGAYPSHPGEVLKDEIEYRKISQRKLAENIVMSHTALNEILNGRRSPDFIIGTPNSIKGPKVAVVHHES